MRLVGIQPMAGDHLEWQLSVEPGPEEQEASILLNLRPSQDPKKALRGVLEYNELAWLSPAPKSSEWILDLDELRRIFPDYFPMLWFTGKARVHPSYPTMSLVGMPRTGIEFSLVLPSIGWQLFILDSSQSDPIALPAFLDTYATRLLTEPLRFFYPESLIFTRVRGR